MPSLGGSGMSVDVDAARRDFRLLTEALRGERDRQRRTILATLIDAALDRANNATRATTADR
jgi:hypothetical protein